jgi:hypothetical protein
MWETWPLWAASRHTPAVWPRLAEAGGRPELDLALAGLAGGRIGKLADASGRLCSTWGRAQVVRLDVKRGDVAGHLCGKQGPPRFGQSGADQASPAPEDARDSTLVRLASANPPLGPRWPALSALFATWHGTRAATSSRHSRSTLLPRCRLR